MYLAGWMVVSEVVAVRGAATCLGSNAGESGVGGFFGTEQENNPKFGLRPRSGSRIDLNRRRCSGPKKLRRGRIQLFGWSYDNDKAEWSYF